VVEEMAESDGTDEIAEEKTSGLSWSDRLANLRKKKMAEHLPGVHRRDLKRLKRELRRELEEAPASELAETRAVETAREAEPEIADSPIGDGSNAPARL
jgi:hypothetical protein